MIRPLMQRAVPRTVRACCSRMLSTAPMTGAASGSLESHWADMHMAPPDPIIGLTEAYKDDDFPQKQNVGVGAYRDDMGKPYVLPCVRKAEKLLMEQSFDMEYSGIAGDPHFVDLALKFAYGENSAALNEGRVGGVQSLSGTGGLRVMGELLVKFGHHSIYVPNPSWGNHVPIFHNAGLHVKHYHYYDHKECQLDFDNMMKDIDSMPEGSCILLHACAHNPTGMDPTMDQWKQISDVCKERNLLPFFDCAYQGFASGSADEDAAAIRMFVDEGHLLALVQSFSKNFGLYGHRIGALSVVGADPEEAKRVVSQMKMIIRPMYSNPPRHGARLVTLVLSDPQLTHEFVDQCKSMADRINKMRHELRDGLEAAGSIRSWEHITKQIGMFAFSGLDQDEVQKMRDEHHIYCTLDGRISMAGVTTHNVGYIAEAIHDVTK